MHTTLIPLRAATALALSLGLTSAALADGPGATGVTVLASADGLGLPPPDDSFQPALSEDGRYLAFASDVALVPSDVNGWRDVYVLDRETGTYTCASTTSGGSHGNDFSAYPHISADGRWVVFYSLATNLVALDTNASGDVFRKDLLTGTLERVSNAHLSPAAGNGHSSTGSISNDGRLVAFVSSSSDLIPLDTNGANDVFVRDMQLGTTQRVSEGFLGEANGASNFARISGDGTHVTFASDATNLVPFDTNAERDVFLVELGNLPELISRNKSGAPGNGESTHPRISEDGSVVAFESLATDLTKDTNGVRDVFVYDALTQAIQLASISSAGAQSPSASECLALSRNGRVVALLSSFNLAPFASPHDDVFVRDLELGGTFTASRRTGTLGSKNEDAWDDAALAQGGSLVAFSTYATNMEPPNPFGYIQVYVREMFADPFEYCTPSITSQGCQPSLTPVGLPSVSLEGLFTLVGDDLPNQKNGILFYGFDGQSANPWGSGTMCLAGSKKRTPLLNTGGNPVGDDCTGFFAFDMNEFALGLLGGNPKPELAVVGQQVNVQFWGRDPALPAGTFLSTAVEYVVGP